LGLTERFSEIGGGWTFKIFVAFVKAGVNLNSHRLSNMRRIFCSQPSRILLPMLATVALSITIGCRNTTNSPISTMGNASPLQPVSPLQPSQLSPVQPTSGISPLGAPTRVPPPPTGSYNTPANYSAQAGAPAYGPVGQPSGAAVGSTGMTRGITDLAGNQFGGTASRSFAAEQAGVSGGNATTAGAGSGIRQTSWIGNAETSNSLRNDRSGTVGTTHFGAGFDGGPNPAKPPARSPANGGGPQNPLGGMKVIDLTAAPYPPGYVPPAQRQRFSQPAFETSANIAAPGHPTTNAAVASLGQSSYSTFDRNAEVRGNPANGAVAAFAPANSAPANSAASSPNRGQTGANRSSAFPTTEPYPTEPYPAANEGEGDPLQWRRPSPRF
jgi:hypothetical protein